MSARRVVILGAAGRDFHNFNTVYRDDASREVVAFTATQIPDIAGRRYPASLAGPRYPQGIPILDEGGLAELIARERVDEVVFAYSDVTHETVMHCGSIALASRRQVWIRLRLNPWARRESTAAARSIPGSPCAIIASMAIRAVSPSGREPVSEPVSRVASISGEQDRGSRVSRARPIAATRLSG